ncbi:SWIM-type domain-containing protein [Heracleum sosnowskyi]|uniref:SWIM-type domain-containing protein n=1 Tax=Heracleum sosnowskyi TaxID=360622 RepID=A0AAD8I684_9APIA|nr:SWIM-type domain-containing protein [Heracleum sosnowskyi]
MDQSNFIVAWIYVDGNIRQTQLDGFVYDKSVSKHVKLDTSMQFDDLCDVLCSKLNIDRSKYGLKLFYRCKNPDDMKYGIVPIDDDDDVELMFGVVISKGTPFFVEIYLEKILNCELIESSSRVAEMSSSRHLEGQTSSSRCFGGEMSSSRFMKVREGVESRMRIEKSAPEYVGNSRNYASFDDSVLRTRDDVFSPMELREGMVFATKEELAHTIKQVHIRNHQEIVVTRSNQLNWHVACKWKADGCEWKLKARKRSANGYFQIMVTSGPHTCMSTTITQDHPNLNSSHIVEAIKAQIVADPTIKEKVLMATTKNVFGYQPGRKKVRNAKKLAMNEVHGSWEGSYEDLPHLMEALQSFNVGTKVDWFFKEDELGECGSLEEVTFKRVFWAFKPCVDGFQHCMPVIQIDGTHLYGPYPGVLLSATTVDGFSHILPLAFAIVESENLSSWDWFMERLRRFVAGRRHGICVISDRHAGIMAAMQKEGWCEPHDHHRFCVRHLAANFFSAHSKKRLKDKVVQLASQVQPKKFDMLWEHLVAIEPRAAEWFENKPLMKWSLAHDGQKRFGMMTTNPAECWNKAILDARKLPITSLVRELFMKTVEYFDQRRVEIASQIVRGQIFTKHANKMLSRAITRASGHHVKLFDRETWLFQVVTRKVGLKGGNSHTVRIQEAMCMCGKWQNYRIPCSHLIACCGHVKIKHEMFVGEWYKLENVSKVYGGIFEPIPNKGEPRWSIEFNFPKVTHDKDVQKKKGR